MPMTRRGMLLTMGAGLAGVAPAAPATKMGVAATSYMRKGARDPLAFLDYCRSLGAAGVQMDLRSLDAEGLRTLRARAEQYGMWVEAMLHPPRDAAAVEPFERSVVAAKAAGATVARIAFLPGRRYETFNSLESFQDFAARSWRSLTLAEPIARKHKLRLAIENHKDWRIHDLLGMLQRVSSEWIGSLVDAGNNISLLEDPMAVIEALARYAFATHVKDMAVEDDPEGFLLSEVNLGDGFLDLPRIFATLSRAHPELHFSLEMITRDPLEIPVLTPKYWATMPDMPARQLAATLALVREHKSSKPLPRITALTREQQVKLEDDNVRSCLAYARATLRV